jgi:hypothetical protein
MDQGFFCRIREVDGVPQHGEVAASFPSLGAGRTDARNGPACVGFIDRCNERRPEPNRFGGTRRCPCHCTQLS